VLGPILFVVYIVDVIRLVESHGLSPHLYTDDVQVYRSCSPVAGDALSVKMSDCAGDHCELGEIEQADAEPGHIRGRLVCDKSASASTANCCDKAKFHYAS